jgi:hypothetical protein
MELPQRSRCAKAAHCGSTSLRLFAPSSPMELPLRRQHLAEAFRTRRRPPAMIVHQTYPPLTRIGAASFHHPSSLYLSPYPSPCSTPAPNSRPPPHSRTALIQPLPARRLLPPSPAPLAGPPPVHRPAPPYYRLYHHCWVSLAQPITRQPAVHRCAKTIARVPPHSCTDNQLVVVDCLCTFPHLSMIAIVF